MIKAMLKARETEGLSNAKVVGRYLFINNEKYDRRNVSEYLKACLHGDRVTLLEGLPFDEGQK